VNNLPRELRPSNRSKRTKQSILFVTLVGLVGFLSHLVYMWSGWSSNPDESELIATGRLAALPGGLNSTYTTSTYGPIWPEFLAVLNYLGMNLDHFNAHRLAFLMKLFIFLTPQYLAVKNYGFLKISPALIPLNIVLFAPTSNEFAFLSSELLPLVFMTAAVIIILSPTLRFSSQIAGFLFVVAFLSKYQTALLVIILIYFIFQRNLNDGKLHSRNFKSEVIGFFVSALATLTAFIILLLGSNSLSKFIEESVLLSINYSTTQGFGGGSSFLEKLNVGSSLLIDQPLIIVTLLMILLLIQVEKNSVIFLQVFGKRFDQTSFVLSSFILFFILGLLTISIPGNAFPHYVLFFLWIIAIFLLTFETSLENVSSLPKKSNRNDNPATKKFFYLATPIMVILLCFSSIAPVVKSYFNVPDTIRGNQIRFEDLRNSEILNYCPSKSQVLVWGWSSELFAYFDWTPPSNVVNDVARAKFSRMNASSISRISEAISDKTTDCVYEAIGANFFGGFTMEEGVISLPKNTYGLLSREYIQSTLKDGTTVWSRRR
jgi:hypothetical protein